MNYMDTETDELRMIVKSAAAELYTRDKAMDGIYSATLAVDMLQDIAHEKQEHFVVFSLDNGNRVIRRRIITVGLADRALVHCREVYSGVIADRATNVIFAHNHPSGGLKPSRADDGCLVDLVAGGHTLGIKVLDNIIVSSAGYYSYAESNSPLLTN